MTIPVMAKTKETKYKVEYRPLELLTPLDNNPRWIKSEDFERLCASIQNNPELFEAQPIILSDRTGELVIIAGNQRYKAAKEVGLKEVPTVLLSALTETKEKEIIIRTNVTNGRWDWDALANGSWDTVDLGNWGVDVSFLEDDGTNFDNFFEEVKKEKEVSEDDDDEHEDIAIVIRIPYEEADIKDSIEEIIKTALNEYPNITIE